jgi:site-specific DNA-methyltransferase (cytosine-N4-specific)
MSESAIYTGDCRDIMRQLIAEGVKVQTCVTSPPYWGLRDYGVAGQIGLEPTLQEYVATMTEVFGLVYELLADDGTCWLNLGDSYANDGKWGGSTGGIHAGALHGNTSIGRQKRNSGLKPKDLCGVPWRVAFALQDAGWYLRQDIIWAKPNPMPESVRDRCTKAHEYLFLLTKNQRYYFDADAISEECDPINWRESPTARRETPPETGPDSGFINGRKYACRNKRSVWTIATEPYSGAHFAVMPSALVEPCILAGSRPGDIVFDPFLGSGTVASVAERLGRRYIGIDLNPAYQGMQRERTAQRGMVYA